MFDFKNPDYIEVFRTRMNNLNRIRSNPQMLPALIEYYRDNIADFIDDFGTTFDPRNPEKGLPSLVPFKLMPKQREWVEWLIQHWRDGKPGIVEKTRTVGMSWLSMAVACALCLFNPGMVIGFGSRKQEYVDVSGDLKALFPKARLFLRYLPKEFLFGFEINKHAPFMRVLFPNGSQIVGESGDGIGRGARASIYFVDEAAFLERPQLIEASLSETTNCRIDISTPNGLANPFAEKRFSGKIDVFSFHWRDDPRRDEEWYAKKCEELDAVTIAQELDINYSASVEGVIIPSAWVQAAIDSHVKLGIKPTGIRHGAFDVADRGDDKNAFCGRHGVLIEHIEEWSGVNGDILQSTQHVFSLCDELGYKLFYYDADGLGASVRGDSRITNEQRDVYNQIDIQAFHSSGAVLEPDAQISENKTNADFFPNLKSQSWWALRTRFKNTYRAVVEGLEYNPDEIISISSKLPILPKLMSELSQPTYSTNGAGKILVNKKPDGIKSPNLADSVMMAFAPLPQGIDWGDDNMIKEMYSDEYQDIF